MSLNSSGLAMTGVKERKIIRMTPSPQLNRKLSLLFSTFLLISELRAAQLQSVSNFIPLKDLDGEDVSLLGKRRPRSFVEEEDEQGVSCSVFKRFQTSPSSYLTPSRRPSEKIPSSQETVVNRYETPVENAFNYEDVHVVTDASSTPAKSSYAGVPRFLIDSVPFELNFDANGKISFFREEEHKGSSLLDAIEAETLISSDSGVNEKLLKRPASASVLLADQLASLTFFSRNRPQDSRLASRFEVDSPKFFSIKSSAPIATETDDDFDCEYQKHFGKCLDELFRDTPNIFNEFQGFSAESVDDEDYDSCSTASSFDDDDDELVEKSLWKVAPPEHVRRIEKAEDLHDSVSRAIEEISGEMPQREIWEAMVESSLLPDFDRFSEFLSFEEVTGFIEFLATGKSEPFEESMMHAEVLHDFLFRFYLPRQWDVQLLTVLKDDLKSLDCSHSFWEILVHFAGNHEVKSTYKMFYTFVRSNDQKNNESLARLCFQSDASEETKNFLRAHIKKALTGHFGKRIEGNVKSLINNAMNILNLMIKHAVSEETFEEAIKHFSLFFGPIQAGNVLTIFVSAAKKIKYHQPGTAADPGPEPAKPENMLTEEEIDENFPLGSRERHEAQLLLDDYEKALEEHKESVERFKKHKRDTSRYHRLINQYAAFIKYFPDSLTHFKASSSSSYLTNPTLPLRVFSDFVYFGHVYVALLTLPSAKEFEVSLKARPLLPIGTTKQVAFGHFLLAFDHFIRWSGFLTNLHESSFEAKCELFRIILKHCDTKIEYLIESAIEYDLPAVLEAAFIFGKRELDSAIPFKADFVANFLDSWSRYLTTERAVTIVSHIECAFDDLEKELNRRIFQNELEKQSILKDPEAVDRVKKLDRRTDLFRSMIEVAYLLQFAHPSTKKSYSLPLPPNFLKIRPRLVCAADSLYLLHAVRGIIWRVWKIPFAGTAVSQTTSDAFSLSEAFKGGNLLLRPYKKRFEQTFKTIDM